MSLSQSELSAMGPSCSVKVCKRLDHGTWMADYLCLRCRGRFTKRFHDRYPTRCPYCGARVTTVRGGGHD